jgi:hypothetical protein
LTAEAVREIDDEPDGAHDWSQLTAAM